MSINKCIFTLYTNNCKFVYFFTQINSLQYRVIKKEKKLLRQKISPLIYNFKKKYVRVKIEDYDIVEDELLNTKRNSIIIDSINLDAYMNTLTLDTNTYYNRNIPLLPNYV